MSSPETSNIRIKGNRFLAEMIAVLIFLCQMPNIIAAEDVVPYVEPVFYVDAQETEQGPITEYEEVTSDTMILSGGWNVVKDNITISRILETVSEEDVKLILCDGATLTINGGIYCWTQKIEIYAQSEGTGTLIADNSASVSERKGSGIGGDHGTQITINGDMLCR